MIEIELIHRVLSDPLPHGKVDGLFLFAQTNDNQSSILEAAIALYHMKICDKIHIIDAPSTDGFPGFESWQKHLSDHGAQQNDVIAVKSCSLNQLHTLIEAKSFIAYAQAQAFKRIIIMAAPFNQTRAFMTMVTATDLVGYDLGIYNQPGSPMVWNDIVENAQGGVITSRKEAIHVELKKIATYQQKGDLKDFDYVLKYLDQRQQ